MMPSTADATPPDLEAAKAYFDRFVQAFGTFDGAKVADLFATPGVALRSDGVLVPLTTREDVVRYYQAALDKYRRDGCRSCRWSQLSVVLMGSRSMLAAVTWGLLEEDGTVLVHWRQSYSLSRFGDDGPRAFASASHAA